MLSRSLESLIANQILPELKLGRQDFDLPHTLAVVYWMKHLLQTEASNLNHKVMIVSAYAHDWGYVGLFNKPESANNPKIIAQKKADHMTIGAKRITNLLASQFNQEFSSNEITKIANLVIKHDLVETLQTEEEITLMEADTLGMLDVTRVKPTFNKQDNKQFIDQQIYARRLPKFIHPIAKQKARKLANKRLKYYQSKID